MKNVIAKMRSLYPVSDETVELLKARVTPCRFPKRYQLIKADEFCRSAYFIEEGMTRSFWLVDGEEITTSFAGEGSIVFSMDELYYNKISFKPISSWRIGAVSSIRTNTAAYTVLTKTD